MANQLFNAGTLARGVAVKLSDADSVVLATSASDPIVGITQAATYNDAVPVARNGDGVFLAAENIAAGDYLTANASGQAVVVGAGEVYIAVALLAASTGELASVEIVRGTIPAGGASSDHASLVDDYSPGYTGAPGPGLLIDNEAGDYSLVVCEDDAGPGDASAVMRPMYISTGAKLDAAATVGTGSLELQTGYNMGAGNSGVFYAGSGFADNGNSGNVTLASGAGGTGSGTVKLETGPADSAADRGIIDLRARNITMVAPQGCILPTLAADPSEAAEGKIYFNTATHKFRGYANGVWVDLH